MVKKSELKEQLEQANAKLQLIYESFPYLEHIDEYLSTFTAMGLKGSDLRDVLKGNAAYVSNIRNPQDGEEYAIYLARIEIKVDEQTGQGEITVNGKPYREFFDNSLLKKSHLESMAKSSPEVAALYRENQELRMLLSHK